MTDKNNLFTHLPSALDGESFTALLERPGVRVERIVSHGQASPPGFWYDQEQHEWVLLLAGSAELYFADEELPLLLGPGDYLEIPAHRRHRVAWTTPDEPTIWLAVFHD